MYQDDASKWWDPATITSLCVQPISYIKTTRDGITYRKTQAHLKPYQPQCKKTADKNSDSNMLTLKSNCKQFDNIKSKNNQVKSHLESKRDIKPQIKLDLWCTK